MKLLITGAALVLAAASVPAAQPLRGNGSQSADQTKDRLPPERVEQLAAEPMLVLRKSGLVAAQKEFDALLAAAVKVHGKGSVEAADLLTSFGVQLFNEGFESEDPNVAKASIDYLKRAIPVYRSAFGPRHPEVATALNSYADAALQLYGDAGRADVEAALGEAYSIRLAALGADDPTTKITAEKLADVRSNKSFTSDVAKALTSEPKAIESPATPGPGPNGLETLTVADVTDGAPWKPGLYSDPIVDDFFADVRQLDKADAASRKAMILKYGLSDPALEASVAFVREMTKDAYNRRRQDELRKDALDLVQLSNRAPIALILAAGALEQFANNGCTEADVAQLMDGSRDPDRDLWSIATTCLNSRIVAHALDKDLAARPALLYLGLTWTLSDPDLELAAADMLLRPQYLALVDEKQRDTLEADIASYKLTKLLDLGLLPEALAFGDGLRGDIRTLALRGRSAGFRTSIGGFAVTTGSQPNSPAVGYAAALALVGRNAEARAVLDMVTPQSKLRSVRACLDQATTQDCGVADFGNGKVKLSALVVDQLLDQPRADPYVLMEQSASGSSVEGAAITEALCRLLSQADEKKACQDLRDQDAKARAPGQDNNDNDRALWISIERAGGTDFDTAKATYQSKLAALGIANSASNNGKRISIDPAPAPFRELPIPAAMLAKRLQPNLDPKSLEPLPVGYTLVRAERSGKRVAAISLSQRFDPNGEVTAGGYWLHLSDNGGKTWQAPLYTGLAEHFPFVVPASSRLPMIAGDRLRLEVEESLIDTASIFYPPIATKIRRKRTGIYLDIPIAELRKDSDSDGITDIAARHLLIGGNSRAGAPFIVGNDRNCSTAPTPETLARLEIIKTLFRAEARALIEPVGGKSVLIGGWRTSQATDKPPIFMRGNPADYRCVSVDRLMIIYPDADQDELRKSSPDFQLITLPQIYWNRDHTRGFVKWSMGWTGGTYRLVSDGKGWKLQSISEWIT